MGWDVGQTREFQIALCQLSAGFAFADGDDIAGLALIAGDIRDSPVHGHMAMVHKLPGPWHGWTEAKSEADVVETILEQFQQVGSCGSFLSARFLHVAHELAFGDAVVEAKLLLLFQSNGVFRALATGLAVLTGWIGPLRGLPGETGKVSQAPRDPQARAAVSRHELGVDERTRAVFGMLEADAGLCRSDGARTRKFIR